MAIVTNSNQIKYGGTKYLDPRHDPVANVASLPKSFKEVFEGMTLTVLDSGDGTPKDYWYIGGQWKVKSTGGGESYTAGQYIDISGGEISVTGITPSDYATKAELSGETQAREQADINVKAEAISASTAWVEEQGYLKEVPADYAKTADVATAITASKEEAVSEAVSATTAWTSAQGYLTEVPAEYAKSDDVATAITEAVSTKQDAFEFGQALGLDENNALNVLIDDVTIKLNGSNKLYAVGGGSGQTYTAGQYISIEGNEISVTGITPDDYATIEALSAETAARVEAEAAIDAKFGDYAKADEVSSAITEAQDETFAAATAWTEEQGFLKEVPAEYAKSADVATAITEAQEAAIDAATAWTEEQGYLKEVPSEYVTESEVSSAITEAQDETFAAATAWTEGQGFLTEVPAEYAKSADVATAVTEAQEAAVDAATAWTEEQGYLKEVPAEYATISDVTAATEGKQDAFNVGDALSLEDDVLKVLIDDVTIKLNGSNKLYAVSSSTGGTYSAGQYISIEGNEISVTGITPDDYATISDLSAETQARIEADFNIEAKFSEYPKISEVNSAITEAQDETFAAATAWTEEQGFLKEVPAEYAKSADVATAITEAQEAAIDAATAWTEEQGFLKEVPSEYVTESEVSSAITEAQDETFAAATAWTEEQGYLKEVPAEYAKSEDVATAITASLEEAEAYADAIEESLATAITESKEEAIAAATAWTEEQGYLTGVPAEYVTVNELNNEINDAKDEMFAETTVWVEAQGYIKEVPGGYATSEDVATAMTAAVEASTAWTEEQGYLTEVPSEYVTDVEVSSAITEAQDETFAAATAWTEEQGFLKEVPSTYATKAEVSSAKTEAVVEAEIYADSIGDALSTAITAAQSAAVADATAWTEAQGYLTSVPAEYVTDSEVSSAITEAQDETFAAATAWTEEQGYLTEVPAEYAKSADVATAITEAQQDVLASANSYTDAAVSAITVPEYSISSVTPSSGYSAAYQLTKDGAAVSGSSIINIPDAAGATIRSAITTDVAVGFVSAGTTFSAGTTIESILRAIFISDTPVSVGYAYYGSLATPLDETTGITAENIKAYLTRSESAASTTPWRFRVNAGDYQIIVAVPDTFDLDDANDITDSIPYYYEISNNGDPRKTLTIDGIGYNVYYVTYNIELTRFQMEITLINA